MPVFSQQDPILFGAARGEGAVGKPASGKNGVITGRPQPSAEATQHLVTQKPWHLPDPEPAVMLVYISSGVALGDPQELFVGLVADAGYTAPIRGRDNRAAIKTRLL